MGLINWMGSIFNGGGNAPASGELDDDYISKSLFFSYLDAQNAIVMFYCPAKGWIGANLAFFKTFGLQNMEAFRRRYARISDFFNDASYVIFAEDDGAWMRQLASDDTKSPVVHMTLPGGREAAFSLRGKVVKNGMNGLYFLEMTDITEQVEAKKER